MSDKLPIISGRDCVKALQKLGFELDRQKGSHIILRCQNPSPVRTVVVPDHKSLDRGTLRGIIRQARLTPEEFLEALK